MFAAWLQRYVGILAGLPVFLPGEDDGQGRRELADEGARALLGLDEPVGGEHPDGEPDRAAGCAVGGGQLWLGWQLVPWPQRAGVDLFPQVVGDLPVLGASHRFSVLRAYI